MVSGAYSDDLWFWDLPQDLTNRGCGCYLVRGSLRHMRRHQGVMEFTVAGPHKYPLFSGLACILLQSQSGVYYAANLVLRAEVYLASMYLLVTKNQVPCQV